MLSLSFAALTALTAYAAGLAPKPAACGTALLPATSGADLLRAVRSLGGEGPALASAPAPRAPTFQLRAEPAGTDARNNFLRAGAPLDGSRLVPPGLVIERAVARRGEEPAHELRFATGSIAAQRPAPRRLFRLLLRRARNDNWARTREVGALLLTFAGGEQRTLIYSSRLRKDIEFEAMRAALLGLRLREPELARRPVEHALAVHTHPDAVRLHGPPPSPLALWIAPSRRDYLNLRSVARELWRSCPAAAELPAVEGVVLPYCERGLCDDLFLHFEGSGMRQYDGR